MPASDSIPRARRGAAPARRALAAFALAVAPLAALADIHIGVTLSTTGPGASLGIPAEQALRMWPAEMAGEKVRFTILNDTTDTTTATKNAQRLINEELSSAKEEIASLEATIPPRDRAEFHRLVDKKHGLAVVLAVGGSCSACHVKIRPAALQILKQGREIVYCDSCKRILYYEPQSS